VGSTIELHPLYSVVVRLLAASRCTGLLRIGNMCSRGESKQ
jgi:hypothetical protein